MTFDDDDPFGNLMTTWDVHHPTKTKDDEHEGEGDADNVVVEDASTDDEVDQTDSMMKRSFVVQELFPTSVPIAAGGEDGVENTIRSGDLDIITNNLGASLGTSNGVDDTKAASVSIHSSSDSVGDIAAAEDGTDLVSSSTVDIESPSSDRQADCVDESRSTDGNAAKDVLNPFDLYAADNLRIQQQEETIAEVHNAPTEATDLLNDGGVEVIDHEDQKIEDEVLLSFLDDEAVVSNHHTCPLQINPWQQEQTTQHQQQSLVAQESLLDIPFPTYDHGHSYHDLQSSSVQSIDNNVEDDGTNNIDFTSDNHLHNNTDVTVTTATVTTAESTNANENVEEDSLAAENYEVGIARRDLEVNYAFDTEQASGNKMLDDKRNYLDGRKISRTKGTKGGRRHGREKRANINDIDVEQAVLPGTVAYTQLGKQEEKHYEGKNGQKAQLKIPYKLRRQRRCIATLCIVVVVLLASIAGLLYYLIASPRGKVATGNGNSDLIETIGNTSDIQNTPSVLDEVNDEQHPPRDPAFDDVFNTTVGGFTASVAQDTNITSVDDNNLHHENSSGAMQDENSTISNNASDSSVLMWNSSTSTAANDIGEDVFQNQNDTAATITELSLTTLSGEALVSGISKSYGIVFDVESLVPSLTITGMDLYLDTSFETRYEVWLAEGSWRDGAAFVEIAHGNIDGTGVCHDVHVDNCQFAPIPSDEFDSTTITIGQRRSFWVTLRDDDLVSHNRFFLHDQNRNELDFQHVDEVYAANGEMNVYYGTSILTYPIQLADPETEYRHGRGFIGRIRYKIGASGHLAESAAFVDSTEKPVIQTSENPSAQPSISPTSLLESVDKCHYVTEEACREAATSLGLHLGGGGFPFAGPYSRAGCHFYSCSNCLFGGIAYFGTKGTLSEFQSTHSVHSEKRLDCNTNLYSIADDSPFWCLFPTTKCSGC